MSVQGHPGVGADQTPRPCPPPPVPQQVHCSSSVGSFVLQLKSTVDWGRISDAPSLLNSYHHLSRTQAIESQGAWNAHVPSKQTGDHPPPEAPRLVMPSGDPALALHGASPSAPAPSSARSSPHKPSLAPFGAGEGGLWFSQGQA